MEDLRFRDIRGRYWRCRVESLGYEVWGKAGFRVQGLGFRIFPRPLGSHDFTGLLLRNLI